MTDRLSSLDVSFLYLEGRTTPMHVGGLLVFQPPDQPESDQLGGQTDEIIERRFGVVSRIE